MNRFLIERDGGKVTVILVAELTAAVASELRELLLAIDEDGGHELVLDCTNTAVLDCAGLSLLLAARNSYSPPPKRLELVNVQPSVFALLETLRLKEALNARME